MIKEIKTSFQLIRYGYGLKSSIFLTVAFLCLAFLLAVASGGNLNQNSWMESYFILITVLWPLQVLYSTGASKMVQSSVWKKKLETSMPVLTSVVSFLLMYLVVLGLKAMQLGLGWRNTETIVHELVLDAALILLLMLYSAVAYKLFVLSFVLFMISFFGFTIISNMLYSTGFFVEIPLWAGVALGFLAIAVGGVLEYGISLLCYRIPFSKNAQLAGLRKYM